MRPSFPARDTSHRLSFFSDMMASFRSAERPARAFTASGLPRLRTVFDPGCGIPDRPPDLATRATDGRIRRCRRIGARTPVGHIAGQGEPGRGAETKKPRAMAGLFGHEVQLGSSHSPEKIASAFLCGFAGLTFVPRHMRLGTRNCVIQTRGKPCCANFGNAHDVAAQFDVFHLLRVHEDAV